MFGGGILKLYHEDIRDKGTHHYMNEQKKKGA